MNWPIAITVLVSMYFNFLFSIEKVVIQRQISH